MPQTLLPALPRPPDPLGGALRWALERGARCSQRPCWGGWRSAQGGQESPPPGRRCHPEGGLHSQAQQPCLLWAACIAAPTREEEHSLKLRAASMDSFATNNRHPHHHPGSKGLKRGDYAAHLPGGPAGGRGSGQGLQAFTLVCSRSPQEGAGSISSPSHSTAPEKGVPVSPGAMVQGAFCVQSPPMPARRRLT